MTHSTTSKNKRFRTSLDSFKSSLLDGPFRRCNSTFSLNYWSYSTYRDYKTCKHSRIFFKNYIQKLHEEETSDIMRYGMMDVRFVDIGASFEFQRILSSLFSCYSLQAELYKICRGYGSIGHIQLKKENHVEGCMYPKSPLSLFLIIIIIVV